MTESKHLKIWLLAGFLFALLCSHLPVVHTLFYHDLTGMPAAVSGRIDLTGISLSGNVVLDGDWEFYWNRLISGSTGVQDRDFFIRVPGSWSKYKTGKANLSPVGYASYKLKLYGLNTHRPITVYIPDFGSAYRVFIDGELTAESGVVSENPEEVFTTTGVKLYPVTLSDSSEHTVVIETATTRFGGLYMAPVLKDFDRAVQDNIGRNTARLILFGTVLFALLVLVGIYCLALRKERQSFRLPAMGFLVLLRIMLTTEFYSLWQHPVFFGLSYEDVNPLIFLVSFAFKYLLIYLIEGLLGIGVSRKEKNSFLLYYTLLYLIYLFTPLQFYVRYLTIALPAAAFAAEVYAFAKVLRSRRQLKKYGLPIYWGTVVAITGLIIDSYYINGSIYLNLSLSLLLSYSVFMIILSLVTALKTADLRSELALSAARLESVKKLMDAQSDYYNALSAQINEIRAVRHDMRHFVGVMKRLADEGRYEELRRFLNECTDTSETAPLPVFCDNVVVNSIIGYYSLKAAGHNILFCCVCSVPERLPISDENLCVVLGNTLENALEACQKVSPPRERFIRVEAETAGSRLLIRIENSYDGRLEKRNGEYISTKPGQNHGIGLRNIKKIAESGGGYLKTEHTDTTFTLMAALSLTEAPKP